MDTTSPTREEILQRVAIIREERLKKKPDQRWINQLFKEIRKLDGTRTFHDSVEFEAETEGYIVDGNAIEKNAVGLSEIVAVFNPDIAQEIDAKNGWIDPVPLSVDDSEPLARQMAELLLAALTWLHSKDPIVIQRKLAVLRWMLDPCQSQSLGHLAKELDTSKQNLSQWASQLRDRLGIRNRLMRTIETCQRQSHVQRERWRKQKARNGDTTTKAGKEGQTALPRFNNGESVNNSQGGQNGGR